MLGERDQDREAVHWELGDSTPPPFNNNNGGNNMGGLPPGMQYSYGDDGTITTNNNYGNAGGGGGASTGIGKEVRYAPFPNTQSPTHSNNMSQAPLQRAHSRYF